MMKLNRGDGMKSMKNVVKNEKTARDTNTFVTHERINFYNFGLNSSGSD